MAMGFSESDVISLLQQLFATSDSRIRVGIGDDAAVVNGAAQILLTSDMAVEGTHFQRAWSTPFDIGRKITAANIADVIAMGGQCQYLTAALCLTGEEELSWIESLALGMRHEAALVGAHIVGGDIARGPLVVISMAATGFVQEPILRSGATVGDQIFISSLPGWSAAGLELLQREVSLNSPLADKALSEFSAPTLDYEVNYQRATALADVSDSLLTQAEQIAHDSQVALHLNLAALEASAEFSQLNELAQEVGGDIWSWILGGGEDHIFLATGRELAGICIGEVEQGAGVKGVEMKKTPVSWSHFPRSKK
jgi:thiamine-monophosphate kinase